MTGTSSGAAGVGAVTASARASLLCSTLVDTPLFKRKGGGPPRFRRICRQDGVRYFGSMGGQDDRLGVRYAALARARALSSRLSARLANASDALEARLLEIEGERAMLGPAHRAYRGHSSAENR